MIDATERVEERFSKSAGLLVVRHVRAVLEPDERLAGRRVERGGVARHDLRVSADVEVLSTTRYLDMARGEADLALRLRRPQGKDLEVLAEIDFENAAWVSQALATKLPKRPRPHDVPWSGWAPPFEDLPPQPMLESIIPGFVPAFTSDNFLVNLAAAEAGAGAIVLGRVTHRFSRARGIVPIDLDMGPGKRGMLCLVCPKSALDIPRVRLVADLLQEQVKSIRRY